MNGKKLNLNIIFALILAVIVLPSVYAVPVSWYGNVTINSNTSTDGAIVTAHINNSNSSYVQDVVGTPDSGYYLLHVSCSVGDTVYFRVYNVSVNQSAQSCPTAGAAPAELNLTMGTLANGAYCSYGPGCTNGYCVHNFCRSASTYCGDGYCDSGESCTADCGTSSSPGGGGGSGTTTASDEEEIVTEDYVYKPGTSLDINGVLQDSVAKLLGKKKLTTKDVKDLMDNSNSIYSSFQTTRSITTTSSKSILTTTLKYSGINKIKNLIVYDRVPKDFATSSSDITVTATGFRVEVVKTDPEFAFSYGELNPNQQVVIKYEVAGDVGTNLLDDFSMEIYAESLEEAAVCGNGICEAGENPVTCASDCPKLSPPVLCTPGEIRCSGSALQKCNDAGDVWETIEICPYGCGNNACNPSPPFDMTSAIIGVVVIIIAIILLVALYARNRKERPFF